MDEENYLEVDEYDEYSLKKYSTNAQDDDKIIFYEL